MRLDPGSLPEPPRSVLEELKGIHPGLTVVRSRFYLDKTGNPLLNARTGEPRIEPLYWVALDEGERRSFLFPVTTPEGEFMPVDRRLVRRIGTDIARVTRDPEKLERMLQDISRKREEKAEQEREDRRKSFVEENKPAFREALKNAESGIVAPSREKRDEKIYSYKGQPVRSRGLGTVEKSASEKGIYTGG